MTGTSPSEIRDFASDNPYTRLFFYGDRYAGTWQHGKVGHMSGRIEKKGPADQ
jgi:hypothetical protein